MSRPAATILGAPRQTTAGPANADGRFDCPKRSNKSHSLRGMTMFDDKLTRARRLIEQRDQIDQELRVLFGELPQQKHGRRRNEKDNGPCNQLTTTPLHQTLNSEPRVFPVPPQACRYISRRIRLSLQSPLLPAVVRKTARAWRRARPQKDSGRHASRWRGRCANRGPKSPCDDRAATEYGRTWDNAISLLLSRRFLIQKPLEPSKSTSDLLRLSEVGNRICN